MNHSDLAADLPFFANGTLDAERTALIAAELTHCERCVAELHSIEALRTALLRAETAAEDRPNAGALLRDVWMRIDADAASTVPFVRRRLRLRPLQIGGGLAAVLALGIGLASFPGRDASHPDFGAATIVKKTNVVVPADAPVAAFGRAAAPVPPAERDASNAVALGMPAGSLAAQSAAAPEPQAAAKDAVTSRSQRLLARNGSMSLIVADVGGAIAKIAHLADARGGVIVSLDDRVPASTGAPHTAELTLDVPNGDFDATMTDLAGLGTSTGRTVGTEDLTGSIVDTDSRLRNLRREETDLLKIMDRSGKIPDVLTVEQQLADVRGQIEELDGQSKSMRARVADATIVVSLSDERTVVPAAPGAGLQLSSAWNRAFADSGAFGIRILGRLFELLAFAPYLIVVAAIGYAIYRRARMTTKG